MPRGGVFVPLGGFFLSRGSGENIILPLPHGT